MIDFISNNVVLSLALLFLVFMILTGKISGVIIKGIGIVVVVLIVLSLGMALVQKGTDSLRSLTPGNILIWVVGEAGSVGGSILNMLFGAGQNMQAGYRSCLYDAMLHNESNKNGNTMVAALKRQCPNTSPQNQDAEWERCLSSVLGEYDPTAITTCQSKYQSPAGLTKSTAIQTKVCGWFPSLCSASK